MKKFKSLLLHTLGLRAYLQLTSWLFFRYFKKGWLRSNPLYQTHYFVNHFIHPGDTVIDIGANLGYYSVQFAKLAGRGGKVYSVEPIEVYRKILTKNLEQFSQVEILPYALGESEGMIKMGNPSSDKFRHGLMKVMNEKEIDAGEKLYEVPMKNPASLFGSLSKINYIKCDIEGYEVPVIPAMRSLIEQHQPIMQIETDGENKKIIFDLLQSLNYRMFYVADEKLHAYNHPDALLPGDLIGIPSNKTTTFSALYS